MQETSSNHIQESSPRGCILRARACKVFRENIQEILDELEGTPEGFAALVAEATDILQQSPVKKVKTGGAAAPIDLTDGDSAQLGYDVSCLKI